MHPRFWAGLPCSGFPYKTCFGLINSPNQVNNNCYYRQLELMDMRQFRMNNTHNNPPHLV